MAARFRQSCDGAVVRRPSPSGMRTLARIVLSVVLPAALGAQASPPAAAPQRPKTVVGFELDALPYLSGGYYASAWLGRERVRIRPVYTKTTLPGFIVPDGFANADLEVYALIADYFFADDFRGFWLGAGAEYWKNSVENSANGGVARWHNTIATVGGGYLWYFAGNFYLNPWAAGHAVVGGPMRVTVGGAAYNPSRVTPEVSLKIGWHF